MIAEEAMDDSRFDNWTRRRFGLAIGGLAAGVSGLPGLRAIGVEAGKGKRCRKLQQPCKPSGKKKRCCKGQGLLCEIVVGLNGRFCCRSVGAACTEKADCCGFLECVDGECSEDVN
jgi:hypothetical protein